jgi:hypothetical protein
MPVPPRSKGAYRLVRYGRTKIAGAAPFFVARNNVTGLRFRFTWSRSAGKSRCFRENSRCAGPVNDQGSECGGAE